MRLRFFTEYLYPDATMEDGRMGKFSFGLTKDSANPMSRPCYMTIITKLSTDRILRCTPLLDRSICAETIEVVLVKSLFNTQRVVVKVS